MPSHRDRSRSRSRDRDRERSKEKDKYRSSRDRDREGDSSSHRHHRPKHDERSVSPDRDRDRDRKKSKRHRATPSDDEDLVDLEKIGVKEITEEDYFLKSYEFKLWLKDERGKYLDEMSSESAHKHFRKFVRRWNDGALKPIYYKPPTTSIPAAANTGYKWGFAQRGDAVISTSLASIRADVDRMTHSSSSSAKYPSDEGPTRTVGPTLPPSGALPLGPSLPSASDRQYALESSLESKKYERKLASKEAYSKADEMVPRAGGKEGKMEERRATNFENRKYRDKDMAAGLEVEESTLLGDGGGFAAALKARDEASARRMGKKDVIMADRRAADQERLSERKAKESATMDMFRAMAKERFGG
ncbi:hypothetical protein CI109_104675 [Kwoniella shandongensis]|uniref:Uncharacterized protein n=1 Tax=Kwoniella shandongensis TaxID=1734106 RepID=A0A5M6BXD7_9TREE|nr:uncharacterized protein CI109_004840 [Kwoniella shandongensis]KAA5526840.1 hypothetical protein CI109_004840 [Kwoniella shandongensis]